MIQLHDKKFEVFITHEEIQFASQRRLMEELGLCLPLHYTGYFIYNQKVGSKMYEHELDHVFVGHMIKNQNLSINGLEIIDTQWINMQDLENMIKTKPFLFCSWLAPALQFLLKNQTLWDL